MTRQERHIGKVVLGTEVEDEAIGQDRLIRVAGVPVRIVIVIEHAFLETALVVRLGGRKDHLNVRLGALVDQQGLVDRTHDQAVDRLVDRDDRVGNVLLGDLAGIDQRAGVLDRLGELGIRLGGVGVLGVLLGPRDRLGELRGIHALLDGHLVRRLDLGIRLGAHRDGRRAGLLAAHVPGLLALGVDAVHH